MLVIDRLQVRADAFGGPALLGALSLQVKRGEAVGLVGPSGCGKTTLLRSIAGLIDPIGGAVTFDGKTPGEWGWPAFLGV
ncbi:MAG: ATP-binding cassette domain-containing protein [Phycisphaerales bacterium]